MRPIIIGKINKLSDLNNANQAFKSNPRSHIQVLIIDDEPFAWLDALRDEDFNIKQIKDIEDFNAVEAYPVVICDIKGVGHKFSKEQEGAYVVKQLKSKYPFKQFAVYSSGSDYKLDSLKNLTGVSTIKKDIDKEQWCACIDDMIHKASDPKLIWVSIRNYLLEKDVPLMDIMFLESNYVDIINNRPNDIKKFPENRKTLKISSDIRAVVQSMIASGLVHLLGL